MLLKEGHADIFEWLKENENKLGSLGIKKNQEFKKNFYICPVGKNVIFDTPFWN